MIIKGIGIVDGDDNNNDWELDYGYVINYFHTIRNPSVFDNTIDDVLKKIEIQYQSKITEHDKQNKDNNTGYDFSNIDTQLLEEQLKSLIEAKILYTFKECEILLKSIIQIIYKGNNKELYKWHNLKSALC